MTLDTNQMPDLEMLAAVIAHSQIVIPAALAQPVRRGRLPAGFEEADIAILDWIAAEGLRAGRSFVRM